MHVFFFSCQSVASNVPRAPLNKRSRNLPPNPHHSTKHKQRISLPFLCIKRQLRHAASGILGMHYCVMVGTFQRTPVYSSRALTCMYFSFLASLSHQMSLRGIAHSPNRIFLESHPPTNKQHDHPCQIWLHERLLSCIKRTRRDQRKKRREREEKRREGS